MKKSKVVLAVVNILGGALLLWVILSYLNIVAHNATDCEYWAFNFFTMMFN